MIINRKRCEELKRHNVAIVDLDYGEIMQDGEYYLRSRKQDEGFKQALEKERYISSTSDKHWVASYHDPIEEVSSRLSLTETGAIIKLIPYMRFKTNGKLIKDGKPIKQADIQRVFKRGKTATRDILNKLESEGVISVLKEGRSNVFYISARFHDKGSVRDSDKFTKLYQVRTREITDELELHEAGILYKILPYFHYTEYYLVDNPDEEDVSKLRYIGRNELAKRIGMRRQDLTKAVNKLRSKGALMSTNSSNSTLYLVHPDVMFRQTTETEWTEVVRKMFANHTK